MSSTTPNLGLIKPAETEVINVADINTNSDKIDVSYKNMVDQAKQLAEQIKTAQETLNNMNGLIQANKNAITQLNSEAVKAVANSAGKEIGLWIGKLSDTQNYLQFRVDGTDKGYLVFDVSRNIE